MLYPATKVAGYPLPAPRQDSEMAAGSNAPEESLQNLDRTTRFELARDVILARVSEISSEIANAKASGNVARVEALRVERRSVLDEYASLGPDDLDKIARLLGL